MSKEKQTDIPLGGSEDLTRYEPLIPRAKFVEEKARAPRERKRTRQQVIRETTDETEFKEVTQEVLNRVQRVYRRGEYDKAHNLYKALVSDIKINTTFKSRSGPDWKLTNPFTGRKNDINSIIQTHSLKNIANKIAQDKAKAQEKADLIRAGELKEREKQEEEKNRPPPTFEEAVGNEDVVIAIASSEEEEEDDERLRMRAGRREFIRSFESKLRSQGVQNLGGTLGVSQLIPDNVINSYLNAPDKDAFTDEIVESYQQQLESTDLKRYESKLTRGRAEQIAESSIGKKAKALINKIKRKALKEALKHGAVVGGAIAVESVRNQPEEQKEEVKRPDNVEDRAMELIQRIDKHLGVKSEIDQAERSNSQIADAINQIKEQNDDDPAYRGDMWLRPEFKNIIYDIAKLKFMETPEFKAREDKTLTDLVYVPEVSSDIAGEYRDIDKDDVIMRLNKLQHEIRYLNTLVRHYDYTPPGTKHQLQYPYEPPVKRVNPKRGLEEPPLYRQQIMNPSELLDRQPRPRWESPATMDNPRFHEPDTMSNWVAVDELSIIDRVASLPNPRNLPLPMLARQYQNLRY